MFTGYMPTYLTLTDLPIGTPVIITSWGYGVNLDLVRTTGTIVGHGRTRAKVELDDQDYRGTIQNIRPDQLKKV